MTREQALQEARRRWGPRAYIHGTAQRGQKMRYEVGIVPGGGDFVIQTTTGRTSHDPKRLGRGPSWEAAFADAERRESCRRSPVADETLRDKAAARERGAR